MDYPDKDELVIAIIKKILPYGAFCVLPEYNNMEAFLHVSEVAPRWIKNIHEFVSEGQQHVAKIQRVEPEKNQVDISLKRVNEQERKAKLEYARTSKRAEKLLDVAIKNSKLKLDPEKIRATIEKEYGDVWSAFSTSFENGPGALKDLDIPEELKKAIEAIAIKNIKKPTVNIAGIANITCWGSDGVDDIKEILAKKEEGVGLDYLGAPRYKVMLSAENYKDGEKRMGKIIEKMEATAKKCGCDFTFQLEKA